MTAFRIAIFTLLSLFKLTTLAAQVDGFSLEVYGYRADESTERARRFFSGLEGVEAARFFNASVAEVGKRMSDLTNYITAKCDVPLLPKSVERRTAPPIMHNQNRDRYYARYLSPLIGVFYANDLIAVVVGHEWYGREFWYDLVAQPPAQVGLYIHTLAGEHQITDPELHADFQKLFDVRSSAVKPSMWK